MTAENKGPSLDELINSALEEVTPGASNAPVSDPPEDPPSDDVSDESPDSGEGTSDDGEVDDGAAPSETSDEEGDGADGEGESASGEGEGEGAEAAAAATAAAAAADAAKSDADKQREKEAKALNDPIPKDVSLPTQQRMRELIKLGKESVQRAEVATQQVADIAGAMQSCGITPPQYKEWLEFMREFNSADTSTQAKALDKLEDMADRLAGLLGKERRSTDVLAQYPDLAAAVTAGQTTRKLAMEVALQRRQANLRQQSQDQFRTEQQTVEQQQEALNSARTELNALDAQLAKSDPQFAAKKELLVPQLKPLFKRLPPAQWKDAFLEAYRNTKISSAGSALAASRRGVPPKQPLRTKSGNNEGQKPPSSGLEAMNLALASMGRK